MSAHRQAEHSSSTMERNVDPVAAEALALSEARLRAASELVGLAVYAWDPRTDALEWDDRLRAFWGLSPASR